MDDRVELGSKQVVIGKHQVEEIMVEARKIGIATAGDRGHADRPA